MRAWPGEQRIERMKVCLNGGRGRADHPAVPLTPAELAASAVAAVAAGATAVHLHPRRADGGESLLPSHVAAAVTAVRQACPATPVGCPPDCGSLVGTRRHAGRRWPPGRAFPPLPGQTSPPSTCPNPVGLTFAACWPWPASRPRPESGR